MSTLAQIQSFWQRRRRQILIGAAVAGAGVAVGTLIYYGFSRRADDSDYDDDKKQGLSDSEGIHDGLLFPQDQNDGMTEESHDDQQLQLHFSKIQTIADTTTLPAVLPHLKARLLSLLDTAPITAALSAAAAASSSKSPQTQSAADGATSAVPTAQEKLRLWEELCLVSFCRSLAAVTSVALLGLFVRTQLNVLGRRVFLEAASAGRESTNQQQRLSVSCQHHFLALADYLPHIGLPLLISDVREILRPLLKSHSLKEPFDREKLASLLTSLLTAVQEREDPNMLWHKYLLPPLGSNFYKTAPLTTETGSTTPPGSGEGKISDADDVVLQELMREMHVVLRGGSFLEALHSSFEALVGLAVDDILPNVMSSSESGVEAEPVNAKSMATKPMPLAKLLPKVAVAASTLLDGTSSKVNVLAFLQGSAVVSFCAGVYSDEGELR